MVGENMKGFKMEKCPQCGYTFDVLGDERKQLTYLKKCLKLTVRNISKILIIPEIVNKVENILGQYQGESNSPFIVIHGELVFLVGSVDIDNLHFILIEVTVAMERNHPTKLRFNTLFKGVFYETELLKFNDNLHMESNDDLDAIKNLIRKRIEQIEL